MPEIAKVCEQMDRAKRILVITGAGLSADSGLPVFRGLDGLYHGDTVQEQTAEHVLSGTTMQSAPELVWRILAQLMRAFEGAEFNRGHQVIQEMERYYGDLLVYTQNVDGLHVQAGSRKLAEVHGSLAYRVCMHCAEEFESPKRPEEELPPRCKACGGVLRPKLVLFGEELNAQAMIALESFLAAGVDLCFSIGTSCRYRHISDPVFRVIQQGGYCVEINTEPTELSPFFHQCLRGSAAAVLDQLWDRFLGVEYTDGEMD